MPTERTIYGRDALATFVAWLAPPDGDWGDPNELRGWEARQRYANHQAVLRFAEELAFRGSRRVYLRRGGTVPISRARFRPPGEDMSGEEGVFGFGTHWIGLHRMCARMAAPGVLGICNCYGSGILFGTNADAAFAAFRWETDEWDLPAPVEPLSVADNALAAFAPRAAAIASDIYALRPTDHAGAEAAIAAHYTACARGPLREVRWFASPEAAVDAIDAITDPIDAMDLTNATDLRRRALFLFDQETEVRLQGREPPLRKALAAMLRQAGADRADRALIARAIERRVPGGGDAMGLASDFERLAWYKFVRELGIALDAKPATFCALTESVWLVYPRHHYVLAVERPIALVGGGARQAMLFSDGDRLPLAP